MTLRKHYDSMDFFKGICCIACVFIHYNFPDILGIGIRTISRIAVPFFFFVSGFFLLNDNYVIQNDRLLNKMKHIKGMLWNSICFYFVFCVLWHMLMYNDWDFWLFLQEKINGATILKFLITNDPFVYAHLWFMFALLYCYALMYPFRFKIFKNIKIMLICAVLCLLGFSFLAEFKNIINIKSSISIYDTKKALWIFNLFVFRALPFFLIGIIIKLKEKEILLLKIHKKYFIYIFLFGSILSLIERYFFIESQFYIGTYIVVIAMGIMSIQYEIYNKIINFIGKKLYIYILHIAVGKTLDLIYTKFHLWNNLPLKYSRVFIILFFTIVVSYIIFYIKNNGICSNNKKCYDDAISNNNANI